MDLLQRLTRLTGASSEAELTRHMARALGGARTSREDDVPGLLAELAAREGVVHAGVSPMALADALAAIASIDVRIPKMLAIATQLGMTESALSSHDALVRRIYEDSRVVGREARASLTELIQAIASKCEPALEDDDLELFVDGVQPSLFFYEVVDAFFEASEDVAQEDDEEEQDDDDEGEDIDEPVRASVKQFLVQSLVLMVDQGRLDIAPAWQRTDVWSLKRKRELIKSLLLGIPLPSIILHARHGKMSIIDGKQRLLSIVKFAKNEFKLPKYDVSESSPLYQCRGAYYDKESKPSLPEDRKSEFLMRELPALVFEDVSEARLRGIFHLYNVAGMKLNAAEIRNAVYQANPVHRVLYVLAGEGDGRTDLGVGGLDIQHTFTKRLRHTYQGSNRRYQGVDFLARYLGYSRASQQDTTKVFGTPSTSRAINNYFDFNSLDEDPQAVAAELIRVFEAAPRYFDVDEDHLAYFSRGADGKRKFSKLAATTHMVATKLLLELQDRGLMDNETAVAASRNVAHLEVPVKQQSATIWDYQARVILGLRNVLGDEVLEGLGERWGRFFRNMEFCRLPVGEATQ